jgi:hypothetical protein
MLESGADPNNSRGPLAKPIYFTRHAREQMHARGATAEEVELVIRGTSWQSAEKGRQTAARVFAFRRERFGRFYQAKEVVPIFVEEAERIVVVTVYTFFSQREVKA